MTAMNSVSGGSTEQTDSFGTYNGISTTCVWRTTDNIGTYQEVNSSTSQFIHLTTLTSSGLIVTATVTFDATNIILSWTRNGSVPA